MRKYVVLCRKITQGNREGAKIHFEFSCPFYFIRKEMIYGQRSENLNKIPRHTGSPDKSSGSVGSEL